MGLKHPKLNYRHLPQPPFFPFTCHHLRLSLVPDISSKLLYSTCAALATQRCTGGRAPASLSPELQPFEKHIFLSAFSSIYFKFNFASIFSPSHPSHHVLVQQPSIQVLYRGFPWIPRESKHLGCKYHQGHKAMHSEFKKFGHLTL